LGICFPKEKNQSSEENASNEELVQFSQEIIITRIPQQPIQASAQEPSDEAAQAPPEEAAQEPL
jgi:hypothetical protein